MRFRSGGFERSLRNDGARFAPSRMGVSAGQRRSSATSGGRGVVSRLQVQPLSALPDHSTAMYFRDQRDIEADPPRAARGPLRPLSLAASIIVNRAVEASGNNIPHQSAQDLGRLRRQIPSPVVAVTAGRLRQAQLVTCAPSVGCLQSRHSRPPPIFTMSLRPSAGPSPESFGPLGGGKKNRVEPVFQAPMCEKAGAGVEQEPISIQVIMGDLVAHLKRDGPAAPAGIAGVQDQIKQPGSCTSHSSEVDRNRRVGPLLAVRCSASSLGPSGLAALQGTQIFKPAADMVLPGRTAQRASRAPRSFYPQ